MASKQTIQIEDRHTPPFFKKIPISIDRGEGVYVWDEGGNRYLDFTSGWAVTCIGHAHPVITEALMSQSRKIIQNPNSGLTYSPARAKLLEALADVLPPNLTRVFFQSSGAEANDAAIKLARKVTGRMDVISTHQSFHGRTISTASATGQSSHREKYNPLMPNYRFIEFNDIDDLGKNLDDQVAAVILEPIQGEGGVRIPADNYLNRVSELCKANGSLLIIDEIQTGFCRTGTMFAISPLGVEADFLTMAKGIAGGFPFGAFATTESVAAKLEIGDHGGTYCGNPLGCAVAHAVIRYLLDHDVCANAKKIGDEAVHHMQRWLKDYPDKVTAVRGKGLLILVELKDQQTATDLIDFCLEQGLFLRQTQGDAFRIFPALTITGTEMAEGLSIIEGGLKAISNI